MKLTVLFLLFMICYGLQPVESQKCFNMCSLLSWQHWGACSSSCGPGTRTRRRHICCPKDIAHNLDLCMAHCGRTDYSTFLDFESCYGCVNGVEDGITSCSCTGNYTGPCCQYEFTCTKPSDPAHGSVTLNGMKAVFVCDAGFTLEGDGERTCQDGVWSGEEATCVLTCSDLEAPTHGSVSISGSVATYSCDRGYSLDGSSERTCSHDKVWLGSKPSCGNDCDFWCKYPWIVVLIFFGGFAVIVGGLVYFIKRRGCQGQPSDLNALIDDPQGAPQVAQDVPMSTAHPA